MQVQNKINQQIMNKYFYLTILFLIPFFADAQINKDGLPFIKTYTPEEYNAAGQNWAIVKDNKGLMYFANNYGLLQYNGSRWELVTNENSPVVRSLATDKNGIVYYGASSDFGMMIPDSIGNLSFFSLSKLLDAEEKDFNNVWGIHIVNNAIYFQSFEKVFRFNLPIDTLNIEELKKNIKIYTPENSFHWSFGLNNTFFVRELGKGLLWDNNGTLELIPGAELFADKKIYVMLPYVDGKILIITRETGMYIYNPKEKENKITAFDCPANELLINSYIYGGVPVDNGNYAVSTLANGIIIIDKNGNIIAQLNEENGLLNSQILSIYYDAIGKILWFSSGNELNNINLGSPFREWNSLNGLNGVISDIVRFKNYIYISTNTGVYYLEDSNEEIIQFNAVSGINFESWDLQIISSENNQKLIVGTGGGVYQIDGDKSKLLGNSGVVIKLKQSEKNPEIIYLGYIDGFGSAKFLNNKWTFLDRNIHVKNTISSIYEAHNGTIYLGTEVAGIIKLKSMYDSILVIDTAMGLPLEGSGFKIYNLNNNIVVAEAKGLFEINNETDMASPYTKFGNEFTNSKHGVFGITKDNNDFWLGIYTNKLTRNKVLGIVKLVENSSGVYDKEEAFSKIIPQKIPLAVFPEENYVWIANENGLFKFNKQVSKNYKQPFNTVISRVSTKNDSILFAGYYKSDKNVSYIQSPSEIPELLFKNNEITFEYSAAFYEHEEQTQYSYRLIGYNENWSKWTTETKFPYTNLHEGDYIFEVKAKNIYGTESSTASYKLSILSPWYRTIWAYISYFIAAALFVWFMVVINTRRLKRDKELLEKIVDERTKEIRMKNVELEQQKEEIQAQRDEIEEQRDFVIEQKDQITEQHDKIAEQQKNIMSSIQYASRIQEAILPPGELLDELLDEHFVLFKPRDIVSGDFYWATRKENKAIIVAADCTGHGVPGAFMSMLGVSFLNEIVNKLDNMHANLVLNELRDNVKNSLRQTGKENEAKDGMDIALCIIDYDKMQLEYSGAFNSLFLIRDNELIKYEADRMPIGIYIKEKESFTNHIVDLKKGDNFYIFSDGYVDQFGGERGSKLMVKRFRELLMKNHQKPAYEQKAALEIFLDEWQSHIDEKGNTYKQIDDILVIGMKV